MRHNDFTRRGLILSGLALLTAGCTSTVQEPLPIAYAPDAPQGVDPRFLRQKVAYDGGEPAGTIVVNTAERMLYLVEENGQATRYGVSVGEEGLAFTGNATIGRKAEWPMWTPTAEMIERKPRLQQYEGGVPGGPDNPLGARALYLYRDGGDTLFRLHGTNEPWSIGKAVSNGCIRMFNDDVVDLYDRTPVGTPVVVV